jgi:peptide/nickel transport system ATP-binding protein
MRIEIEDLHIGFRDPNAGKGGELQPAVRGVDLSMGAEKVAIVGESGSGKSLTARAIIGLTPRGAVVRARKLLFDGIDITTATPRALGAIRGIRASPAARPEQRRSTYSPRCRSATRRRSRRGIRTSSPAAWGSG